MCSPKCAPKIFTVNKNTVKIVNSLGVGLTGINVSSVEVSSRPVGVVMTFYSGWNEQVDALFLLFFLENNIAKFVF